MLIFEVSYTNKPFSLQSISVYHH